MIKIEKDGHVVVCSQNSFDSMYKRLGYAIVNDNQKQNDEPIKIIEKQATKKDEIPVIEIKNEKITKRDKSKK